MSRARLVPVVVVGLLAGLLTSCSPGDGDAPSPPSPASTVPESPTTTQPPPTGSTAPLPPELPPSPQDVLEFFSPSKNLACHLDSEDSGDNAFVGCLVTEHRFAEPATPADCEGDLMPAVWMNLDDQVTYGMCRGDPFSLPQVTLEYGAATTVGDFACLSEDTGVTCWNVKTEHGFVVSRESYRVF